MSVWDYQKDLSLEESKNSQESFVLIDNILIKEKALNKFSKLQNKLLEITNFNNLFCEDCEDIEVNTINVSESINQELEIPVKLELKQEVVYEIPVRTKLEKSLEVSKDSQKEIENIVLKEKLSVYDYIKQSKEKKVLYGILHGLYTEKEIDLELNRGRILLGKIKGEKYYMC